MAIVKATYTKSSAGAKASIRYIEHRPGKDGEKVTRTLFGGDGRMGRWQANRMIDEAEKGSLFFRFVMSPDPKREDAGKDLYLRQITEQTMLKLEERLHTQITWVAAEHDDHAPHRHVHVVAIVPGRLQVQDFHAMRQTATEAALAQRYQRDRALGQQAREKEAQWER
jgi:hypothetical protein